MKFRIFLILLLITLWGTNLSADMVGYHFYVDVYIKTGKVLSGYMDPNYENAGAKQLEHLKKHPEKFTRKYLNAVRKIWSEKRSRMVSVRYVDLFLKGFIWKLKTSATSYNVFVPNGKSKKIDFDDIQKIVIKNYYPRNGNDAIELLSPLYPADNWRNGNAEEIFLKIGGDVDDITVPYLLNYSGKKVDPELIKAIEKKGYRVKDDPVLGNRINKNKLVVVFISSN